MPKFLPTRNSHHLTGHAWCYMGVFVLLAPFSSMSRSWSKNLIPSWHARTSCHPGFWFGVTSNCVNGSLHVLHGRFLNKFVSPCGSLWGAWVESRKLMFWSIWFRTLTFVYLLDKSMAALLCRLPTNCLKDCWSSTRAWGSHFSTSDCRYFGYPNQSHHFVKLNDSEVAVIRSPKAIPIVIIYCYYNFGATR